MLRRWVPTWTTRWCLRGVQHGLAFGHVHADRLLDVDVQSGLAGGDHRQGVPVVGSGDQDDVQVPLLEHLAVVGEGARGLLRRLAVGDDLGGLGEHLLVNVAERDDLHRRDLDEPEQVGLAVPARADQADAFRLRGGRGGDVVSGGCQGQPGRGGSCMEEFATFHGEAPQRDGEVDDPLDPYLANPQRRRGRCGIVGHSGRCSTGREGGGGIRPIEPPRPPPGQAGGAHGLHDRDNWQGRSVPRVAPMVQFRTSPPVGPGITSTAAGPLRFVTDHEKAEL